MVVGERLSYSMNVEPNWRVTGTSDPENHDGMDSGWMKTANFLHLFQR